MSGRPKGKIALVTGGTAGIGLGTVESFVKEGAVRLRCWSETGRAVNAKANGSWKL